MLLKERQDENSDIEWQDINDFRTQYYGEPEARDTTRRGGKLLMEYFNSGWELSPPTTASVGFLQNKQSVTLNADGTLTNEGTFQINDESKLRDTEYLLQLHNYDPRLFEIISAKNSKWNSRSGEDVITLYSSKVTVRPKAPAVTQNDVSAWFDNLDRHYSKPVLAPRRAIRVDADKLLILPISDLHFGMWANMLEAGNEYNCEIAEKLYFDAIADIVERTTQYNFKKVIFTIGGDQANSDNAAGTTTKGTPQNNCIGYSTMMEKLYGMTVKAINILAELDNVDSVEVVLINGNHDFASGISIANFCSAWFRNDDRVHVDTSPLPRKYIKYGRTLFAFAHDADTKKLPQLVADEAREYWSDINNTEAFLQHLHHEVELKEEYHMRVQRLPTFSCNSIWSNNKGYGAKRQCKSFIFDKDHGCTDVLYTII